MRNLIIVGAGGHAAELHDYLRYYNLNVKDEYEVIGFLDDNRDNYNHYNFKEPFLGSIDEHEIRTDVEYLMGIANLEFRKKIITKFESAGAKFTGFIHPRALISPSAKIDATVVISHNASVGPMVELGRHNLLNSRCTIGHDSKVGEFNFISPQVAISGNTIIGNENLLGTNSATIPGMTIGNSNKIAAGMIIYKPVGNGETVMFRHKERLVKQ